MTYASSAAWFGFDRKTPTVTVCVAGTEPVSVARLRLWTTSFESVVVAPPVAWARAACTEERGAADGCEREERPPRAQAPMACWHRFLLRGMSYRENAARGFTTALHFPNLSFRLTNQSIISDELTDYSIEARRQLGGGACRGPLDHGGIARLLRLLDQPARRLERVLGGTRLVEQHGSHRAGDRPRPPVDRERPGREKQTETLGEVGELGPLDMRREHHELLPAPAEDEVAGAQRAAQPVVHVDEQPVAGGVAVGVVDRLEAVEVEEAERRRPPAAPDPRLLGGQRLGERVAVRRARQRVDPRARAFAREGPLEAAAEPVRPGGDEQQARREREREPRRRLEDVEEGDEQRRRQEPADDERAPGGA